MQPTDMKITWSWCHTSLIAATVNAYSIWHNLSLYLRSQTAAVTAISFPAGLNWIFGTRHVSFLFSFFFFFFFFFSTKYRRDTESDKFPVHFRAIRSRNWNIFEHVCLWRTNFFLVAQTSSEIMWSFPINSSRCATSAFHKSYSTEQC